MDLQVIDCNGQPVASLAVSDAVFGRPYNESLVHQCVTTFLMNERQGTRAQKTRGQVAHSTRKPWKQKGTGRARAGMVSSPLWRGGGRVFPNSPDENFHRKINRKMYRAAMSSIYSRLHADDRLFVLDADIETEQPKTKLFYAQARALGFHSFLYVVGDLDESLYLSSRNLTDYHVLPLECVDPICLIKAERVLLSRSVISRIEESLQC